MPTFARVRWSSAALLLLFCCSSLPLLTKKNTALSPAMCLKTSLKRSHEKRKYQFHIKGKRRKAKDERQKPLDFSHQPLAISLQPSNRGAKITKLQNYTWKIKGQEADLSDLSEKNANNYCASCQINQINPFPLLFYC